MPIQSNFNGGMNLFLDDSQIGGNEYYTAFNIRNRGKGISIVKQPVEDTTIHNGKKQGIYSFDNYDLAFVAGFAYYKDITNLSNPWVRIANLTLDPTVDYIYVCSVPSSTVNNKRSLISNSQVNGTQTNIALKLDITQSLGTPSGLIVQDGINQPWFIFSDGTARRLQTYAEWLFEFDSGTGSITTDKREYVPIMKQMFFFPADGIVMGVAPDGVTLLRSVSGRPVDFVVNVDTNGNKGGDAFTTDYSIGNLPITLINSDENGNIVIGTNKRVTILSFDYTTTIFGEPKFSRVKDYNIGVVNQFSYTNVFLPTWVNISYFIDKDGLRSIGDNSNPDDTNEGRNSKFTLYISKILQDINQGALSAIVTFDNYQLFSVDTIYGSVVLVYDILLQIWVSIDDYDIGKIKQFAVGNGSVNPILYAITDTKIYRLYGGNITTGLVKFKAITSGAPSVQVKLKDIYSVFLGGNNNGIISAILFENEVEGKIVEQSLNGRAVENIRFNFNRLSNQCWKVGPQISWNTNAILSTVETMFEGETANIQSQSNRYGSTN